MRTVQEVVLTQLEAGALALALLRLDDVITLISAMFGSAHDRAEARLVRHETSAAGAPSAEVGRDAVARARKSAHLARFRFSLKLRTERVVDRKCAVVDAGDVVVAESGAGV